MGYAKSKEMVQGEPKATLEPVLEKLMRQYGQLEAQHHREVEDSLTALKTARKTERELFLIRHKMRRLLKHGAVSSVQLNNGAVVELKHIAPRLVIDNAEFLPAHYQRTFSQSDVDTAKLLADLIQGKKIPGPHLEQSVLVIMPKSS